MELIEGDKEGAFVGPLDGPSVGNSEGERVGAGDGWIEGALEGASYSVRKKETSLAPSKEKEKENARVAETVPAKVGWKETKKEF